MSMYLKNFGCPDTFTDDWKKLHVTKWIVLCAGMALAVSGYYIGSSLAFLDEGHQMWILCALLWGSAGVSVVAYSIALIDPIKKPNVACRSLKNEEKLNTVSGSIFHNEGKGICTQRAERISELLSTHYIKRNSVPWGFNNDVYFKGKYVGSNGAAKGMKGSLETVYKAHPPNTSNEMVREAFNESSECLSCLKQTNLLHDFFYLPSSYFKAAFDETDGSQKISSSLDKISLFSKFGKWENQTLQSQNEIGFKDINSNIQPLFKDPPEKCIKENIVHMLDKDIEIRNYFQPLPYSFKCEFSEDPYYCQNLYVDETMKLAAGSLVTEDQPKRSETDIFAFQLPSLATLLLVDELRSDIKQSFDNFLKIENHGTETDYVQDSGKQLWSKTPMKMSLFKPTKQRREPILFQESHGSFKECTRHYHRKESSARVSESSGNKSASLLTDSKTCRALKIPLGAFAFKDKLPTVLIDEDMLISETLGQSDMNFFSC